MGVTITATNSKYSFDMGVGGFLSLRVNIAKAMDRELGEHYATMSFCWRKDEWDAFDARTNEILADSRFSEEDGDWLDFLFASDTEGSISHKTCKKILDAIRDVDFGNRIFVYAVRSDGRDYEHFKDFLQECYTHRRKMRWS